MARNPKWHRDELILALDLYFKVGPHQASVKHPDIIALSKLLNLLPIHRQSEQQDDFRNPNGVHMKLCNFLRLDPGYHGKGLQAGSKLEEEVWADFAEDQAKLRQVAEAIRENYPYLTPADANVDDDDESSEGKILTRTHRIRERNSKLTKKKKAEVLKSTGLLNCEVCGFDFHGFYGEIGQGFAECHHKKPVSQLKPGEKTRLSDLSIVCANCHRMIHRGKPWLTIEELKGILKKQG